MLNKTTQYGIIIVNELKASPNKPVAISTIAKRNNLSSMFLDQVARKMREAKMIKSFRGPGGGYALEKTDINMFELISLLSTNYVMHNGALRTFHNTTSALSKILV